MGLIFRSDFHNEFGTSRPLAKLLRDFQHQPALIGGFQRVEDRRQVVVEMHVDDRADHLSNTSD